MARSQDLFHHLFNCREDTGNSPIARRIMDDAKQRLNNLCARFNCDAWDNLAFVLYGDENRGFAHIRGSSTVDEGCLYVNDTTAGDEAWVSIGVFPEAAIAGNLLVTYDSALYRKAVEWLGRK